MPLARLFYTVNYFPGLPTTGLPKLISCCISRPANSAIDSSNQCTSSAIPNLSIGSFGPSELYMPR